MSIGFHSGTACALAVVLCGGPAQGARPADSRPVHVLLQDGHRVAPSSTLRAARAIAEKIHRQAGIEIVWLDIETARQMEDSLGDGIAAHAFLRSLHVIRFTDGGQVSEGAPSSTSALGQAMPGTRVARILYRRVEQMARDASGDVSVVLGHVMAHELGHLLLRQPGHAAAGVMAATLDIQLAAQGRLLFTEEQAKAMRAGQSSAPHLLLK